MVPAQTQTTLTFEEYLDYNDGTDTRYELVRGRIVAVSPPTLKHLLIAKFLERILDEAIRRSGLPLVALREAGVQTEIDSSRLPDVCLVTAKQVEELLNQPAIFRVPARLAIEIVSPSSVKRDYEEKPPEYANKGILEYSIVDPLKNKVSILTLTKGVYSKQVFAGDDRINSSTFPKLELTVLEILSA